jgi:hypothetical protein
LATLRAITGPGTFWVIARLFSVRSFRLAVASRAYLACCGFGFVRNTAATAFRVFYRLQVTRNFYDAPLLQPAPNRPDYIHFWALWLHGHRSVAVFALEWQTDRVIANIFIASPLFEIPHLLVRLDQVVRVIVNANH